MHSWLSFHSRSAPAGTPRDGGKSRTGVSLIPGVDQSAPFSSWQTMHQAVSAPPRQAKESSAGGSRGDHPKLPPSAPSTPPTLATPPASEPHSPPAQGSAPAALLKSPPGLSASADIRTAIGELHPLVTAALDQASTLERDAGGFLRLGFQSSGQHRHSIQEVEALQRQLFPLLNTVLYQAACASSQPAPLRGGVQLN